MGQQRPSEKLAHIPDVIGRIFACGVERSCVRVKISAAVPVVRLEIRASRLADNTHSCREAKAGVIDLHDPRFVHFHTDYSIVANTAAESGRVDDRVRAPHGETRVVRVAVVQTNENGLCSNPPIP